MAQIVARKPFCIGAGRNTAILFAKEGAKVIFSGRRPAGQELSVGSRLFGN
jgi:NAD(P)-dependent dehydrogenase (short-subunit alcohol dehydrogenase family)